MRSLWDVKKGSRTMRTDGSEIEYKALSDVRVLFAVNYILIVFSHGHSVSAVHISYIVSHLTL